MPYLPGVQKYVISLDIVGVCGVYYIKNKLEWLRTALLIELGYSQIDKIAPFFQVRTYLAHHLLALGDLFVFRYDTVVAYNDDRKEEQQGNYYHGVHQHHFIEEFFSYVFIIYIAQHTKSAPLHAASIT